MQVKLKIVKITIFGDDVVVQWYSGTVVHVVRKSSTYLSLVKIMPDVSLCKGLDTRICSV